MSRETPMRRGSSFSLSGPLKSTLRSKFSASYESLLSGEQPWLLATPGSSASSSLTSTPNLSAGGSSYFSPSGKKPSAPRARFYADLLCLKVEPRTVDALFAKLPARQLVDDDEGSKGARIRENVGSLWRECLRVWTDVPENDDTQAMYTLSTYTHASDEVRRANAIETLIALSGNVLSKNFAHSSSSLDLIWIFAGGIDDADDVFEQLVSAIDEGLRGELDNVHYQRRTVRPARLPSSPDQDASLIQQRRNASLNKPQSELPTLEQLLHHRRRAVELAIIWISHASTTNLAAYFVRRDLFVGASAFLDFLQSVLRSAQTQTGSPLDLADEDATLLRVAIRDTTLLIGLLASLGQSAGSVGSSLGSSGSLSLDASSNPYFRRICDWVDQGSMHLIRDALAVELELVWKAYEQPDALLAASGVSASASLTASLGSVTESLRKFSVSSASDLPAADANLPLPIASLLLPLYLLCRANSVFVEILLKSPERTTTTRRDVETRETQTEPEKDESRASFSSSFFSLSSYLACHGSLNERSRSYSRLILLTTLTILASSTGFTALATADMEKDIQLVKQCQQRSGPLSVRSSFSSPASTVAQGNSITAFISHLNPIGAGATKAKTTRTRYLTLVLDTCVQYMRHNMRKRLDTSGYLLSIQSLLLVIQSCAQRRIVLEYSEWSDVWNAISGTVSFLVGRHTELRGVEIGKLGQALLSVLSLALSESDRFLATRQDIDALVYEIVRSSEQLRRLAIIVALGRDVPDTGYDANIRTQVTSALPRWRLIDLVLAKFEAGLEEWSSRKSSRSMFGLNLSSMSYLAPSIFGTAVPQSISDAQSDGSEVGVFKPSMATSTSSGRLPDVHAAMQVIASMNLEIILNRYQSELEGSKGGAHQPNRTAANGNGPDHSSSRLRDNGRAHKDAFVDEEWLERAELQCLSEAYRFAAVDMRAIL